MAAILVLAVLFWSGNWIAGRVLSGLIPPAALTFWRWAIALALLAPFVAPRLWAARGVIAAATAGVPLPNRRPSDRKFGFTTWWTRSSPRARLAR